MKRKATRLESTRRIDKIKDEMFECIAEVISFSIIGFALIFALFTAIYIIEIDRDILYTIGGWFIISPLAFIIGSISIDLVKRSFRVHARRINKLCGKLTTIERQQLNDYIEECVESRVAAEEEAIYRKAKAEERFFIRTHSTNPAICGNNIAVYKEETPAIDLMLDDEKVINFEIYREEKEIAQL